MSNSPFIAAAISWMAAIMLTGIGKPDEVKPHPWCPPFGLERVGARASKGEFEADAMPYVEPIVNMSHVRWCERGTHRSRATPCRFRFRFRRVSEDSNEYGFLLHPSSIVMSYMSVSSGQIAR
jgi:hypothetical protein